MSSGTVTTTNANDLLFAAAGASSATSTRAGRGYTTRSTAFGNRTQDRNRRVHRVLHGHRRPERQRLGACNSSPSGPTPVPVTRPRRRVPTALAATRGVDDPDQPGVDRVDRQRGRQRLPQSPGTARRWRRRRRRPTRTRASPRPPRTPTPSSAFDAAGNVSAPSTSVERHHALAPAGHDPADGSRHGAGVGRHGLRHGHRDGQRVRQRRRRGRAVPARRREPRCRGHDLAVLDRRWDTTTATNGTHTLTARARDAAGNTTTSTPVTVTVSNIAVPPGRRRGYAFDEGTGTTAADASGHGLTGTLTNGPTWAAGKYGTAVSLRRGRTTSSTSATRPRCSSPAA